MLGAASRTGLQREVLPYRIDPPGATEAVLLLHGFTGFPGELRLQAESLASAGFAVVAPRYPGHGSTGADFLTTDANDWLRRAIDAWLELKAEYRKVHVAGHSMGGAIAVLVASALDVPRLVLLAPALETKDSRLWLTPFMAPFAPRIHRDREPSERDREAPRRVLFDEYWNWDNPREAACLLALKRAARRRLPKVRSRIMVVTGGKDEAVPPTVGPYIAGRATAAASVEVKELELAGHLFPFDADGDRTAMLVREWMTRA